MIDVLTTPASKHDSQWSSWKPISLWCDEHTEPATEATEPSGWILSTLASEQVANFRDQVKRLRVRMNKLKGHREAAADSELKLQLDMVSVAFLVRMPSKEEENEDGVLPELVFAIQDVSVAG
ncbi:hypothetical protein FRC04_001540 [Tulasnella sp. 424]|nr:hypothetical protein FRC04_001540 [Tulasnella sp. 424]